MHHNGRHMQKVSGSNSQLYLCSERYGFCHQSQKSGVSAFVDLVALCDHRQHTFFFPLCALGLNSWSLGIKLSTHSSMQRWK